LKGFTKKIVDLVRSKPELWNSTAIFVTVDEGGGYYDSGYVQPLDFFGDGTRTPLIVVSPYTNPGHISHNYSDHVSILKSSNTTGACLQSPAAAAITWQTRRTTLRLATMLQPTPVPLATFLTCLTSNTKY
jgi:phospholipase C